MMLGSLTQCAVYSFNISVWQALVQTTKNLLAMLFKSALLSFLVVVLIYEFRNFLKGVSIEDAAKLQFGGNSTIEDYGRENFSDVFSDERERQTKNFLSVVCSFSWALAMSSVLFGLEKNIPLLYYSGFFFIMAVPASLPAVFYACGGTKLRGGVLIVIMCIFLGVSNSLLPELMGKGTESILPIAIKAARNKAAIEKGEVVKVKTKKTRKKRLKTAIVTVGPALFIMGMIVIYTTLIFALYNANSSNAWKAAISAFALFVKVAGNKAEIKLIEYVGDSMVFWIGDGCLFGYEFATALLCRVLQLSIPSQQVAQLMSLFGCFMEMGVRVFFFNNYLKDGLRKEGKWTDEERTAYRRRGTLRTQDGNNDMVVEYLSCAAASAILIFGVPTGAFNLEAGKAVDREQVFSIVLFQLCPEIVVDFYCVFMEIYGGLGVFHSKYWSLTTGARTRNGRRRFFGNLIKSFILKAFTTLVLVSMILLSIAN